MQLDWDILIMASFWVVGLQQWLKRALNPLFKNEKSAGWCWWALSFAFSFLFGVLVTFVKDNVAVKIIANGLSVLSISQVGYDTFYKRIGDLVSKMGAKNGSKTDTINSGN